MCFKTLYGRFKIYFGKTMKQLVQREIFQLLGTFVRGCISLKARLLACFCRLVNMPIHKQEPLCYLLLNEGMVKKNKQNYAIPTIISFLNCLVYTTKTDTKYDIDADMLRPVII